MHKIPQRIFEILLIVFSFLAFSYSAHAFSLIQNETVSVSAIVGSIPSIDVGNTGGGGSGGYQSGIRFSGYAYPNALVTVQAGNTVVTTVRADAYGHFTITLVEQPWQLFSLFAVDANGRRSTILNFPAMVYTGYLTDISSIRFAPTITSDKLAVEEGGYITFTGSALPNTSLSIQLDGIEHMMYSLVSDSQGNYTLTVPMNLLSGTYTAKASYVGDARASKLLTIIIGNTSVSRIDASANIPGDCNFDQRVTLTDFSVLAYWFGKPNPPACVDVNHDGSITLVDFSILAFYWNG